MRATGEMAPDFLEMSSKKQKAVVIDCKWRKYCWKTRKKFFTTKASKNWH